MISRSFKKIGALACLVILAVVYQNFDFVDTWKINLIPINEKARSSHAKELMGKSYQGSNAQLVEAASSLGISIFNDVYRNLPKKYKNEAIDMTATLLHLSERYEVDPVFIIAIIKTESSFNPVARGSAGEIGLMQLKPDTAQWIAKKIGYKWKGPKSLENPSVNLTLGMAYFDMLRDRFDGHANKYISSYNIGPLKVSRLYASASTPKDYSLKVMKNYNSTYKRLAAETTLSLIAIR
jgi:soluble lytic murein transglycosylase